MRKLTLNGLMTANDKLQRARKLLAKLPNGAWWSWVASAQSQLDSAHNVLQSHLDAALRERRILEAAKQATGGV